MTPGSGTVVDARVALALWLRDGRARKKLSLDDVARITKIQSRILEKLEPHRNIIRRIGSAYVQETECVVLAYVHENPFERINRP